VALLAAGWLCVALGVIGIILPLMPGTVFLILAAACFTRASPRFERWLLNHPQLGPPVAAWRQHRSVSPRAKAVAVVSIAMSDAILWLTSAPFLVKVGTSVVLAGVALFLLTRPSGPRLTPP
jgi:uncharacterized membrane protein YbaN (DUF454 family)